ncbi:asparagine synthase-related protein [Alteromonas facilis]|uniref:asparagine synthase-related protein n=1 Tax=Alteromonas facilis TaxID=2048004 RepID=UPI000C28BEA5|nr:asparagine synthase-related protein [Alteromonas facilis]
MNFLTIDITHPTDSHKSCAINSNAPNTYIANIEDSSKTLLYTRLPSGLSAEELMIKIERKDWRFIATSEYNFVVALIVESKQGTSVTLIRDRFASQRVLISETPHKTLITTDPNHPILRSKPWDPKAIVRALSSRIVTNSALEKEIQVLPFLQGISISTSRKLQYFNTHDSSLSIEKSSNSISDASAIKGIKQSLKNTFQELQTDEPIAVLLSGGVDSFILAATAAQYFDSVIAYTPDWSDGENPELERAKRFAETLQIPHKIIQINEQDFIQAFDELINAIGVPIRNYSALVLHSLLKHIDETDILYGHYADTLFGSSQIKSGIIDAKLLKVAKYVPSKLMPIAIRRTLEKIKASGLRDLVVIPEIADDVITKQLYAMGYENPQVTQHEHRADFSRERAIEFNIAVSCSHQIFELETSALHMGKRIVSPFYNASMLEISNRLSDQQMFGLSGASLIKSFKQDTSDQVKPLLKQLACEYIEKDAIYQKKLGFPIPRDQWVRALLSSNTSPLYSDHLAKLELMNTETVWSLFNINYLNDKRLPSGNE